MTTKGKIGIIGCGLIGRSWAMLFASAEYDVVVYDIDRKKVDDALLDIKEQLKKLEDSGLLRGKLSAKEQYNLIKRCDTLAECVKDAVHIQESVSENVHLKKLVFKQIDDVASDSVVLCSSTSCIVPSVFSEGLKHRTQVICGHPANPPYYVPIVELIPAPWTDPKIITRTRSLMEEIGQKPVTCNREVFGFAINRMQYAIINECWRLVNDGIMSVEDVDTVMSEGLGMRYAFLGVFETCHLNADGMLDYYSRYGNGILKVTETFGPVPEMKGEAAEEIHKQLCQKVPLEKLEDHRKWRDDCLVGLAKLKKSMCDN